MDHHPAESQQAILAFLADPQTHGGVEVKRIDTHAASVFLAADRALKIKRAVRFPFLDYSTLEKRKAACEAEVEINRAFAPEIYRRALPITREANGRLALDGEGMPVEWAVEMRRFNEEETLDRLADEDRIDAALAELIARVVAAAHGRAPRVDAERWLKALAAFLDQNAADFGAASDLFPPEEAAALDRASRAAFAGLRPLLIARGRRSLVRRGHGDLHLGNIALIDGRPVPFDAIEFDPMIAAGDVLYDLAFLVMDLLERELGDAANVVLNTYLAETRRIEDLDALAALPFFLSLRAAIRAKVTAARLDQPGVAARAAIVRAARTYFRLAYRLIEPPSPTLLAVGGLSGTGKSVLARALAPDLAPAPGAVILRSDVERKALFSLARTERLPAAAYRPEVTDKVYATLADKAHRVLAAGHSAIVDAVFAQAHERAAIAAVAQGRDVCFRGLFLIADLGTRLARAGARERDASDANADVARMQESYDLGAIDWPRIDASATPPVTLARAKAQLS